MAQTAKQRLLEEGVLGTIAVAGPAAALLEALQLQVDVAASTAHSEGLATFGVAQNALGVFDLALQAPVDARQYVLDFQGPDGARTAFRLAVSLAEGPQRASFKLVQTRPGHVLAPAVIQLSADEEWLEPAPAGAELQLLGADLWLVIQGEAGGVATVSLSPNKNPPDDVVTLDLDPPQALLGATGFGIELHGICLDDSPVRKARFFLPRQVPFLGGHAVEADLEIGNGQTPGADLVVHARVPPSDRRPEIDVRIECRDPSATGLASFVPTLVEATMELPLDGNRQTFGGHSITFAAGVPVRARLRYARPPTSPGEPARSEVSLAVESRGPAGLLRISSDTGEPGATIAVAAATIVTALLANDALPKRPAPDGAGSGVLLHELLGFAVGLSSFLEAGSVVLHGAELVREGGAIPAGKAMRLELDYSVAATVKDIGVDVLRVEMQPNQPLRVRVREAVLSLFPENPGLEKIHLDYSKATLELQDPGGWIVKGPGSLFDVLGTRSGRGSLWIEVDLGFKLDLGPVQVSEATLRGTLDGTGRLAGSLRGLTASIDLAPAIDGEGAVALLESGFRAFLDANIQPLGGLAARAEVEKVREIVKLALGVDLPGPIPLANTGLGIYGLGGVFAANGAPRSPTPDEDAIAYQLAWDYRSAPFDDADAFSFGLEAVLGTAPDMGFTFSARAGVFVTAPDLAIRGAVAARVLGPRAKIARDDAGAAALTARGTVVVDPIDGVTVAIEGRYDLGPMLEIVVPSAARFPKRDPRWYLHLGADGWTPPSGMPSEGREMGPVRAKIFPEILDQAADAYLMFRGGGVTRWPRGEPGAITTTKTFLSAFGFGFHFRIGIRPVVWADVFARADILLASNPVMFIGRGTIGGDLNVGPVSVGIEADFFVSVVDGAPPYIKARACGTVDLVFDEVHKCVEIAVNSPPKVSIPEPPHPLDREEGQALSDDKYHVVGRLAATRQAALAQPAVWPDSIPILCFSVAPDLSSLSAPQFSNMGQYPTGTRARRLGGDLLEYRWELLAVSLIDATAADVLVDGALSHAWLADKFGDAADQPQPAELALLTPFGDLWLDALADAGASLPHDPLGKLAHLCQATPAPRYGWAIGSGAAYAGASAFRLPPDPVSASPMDSQVRAVATLEVRFGSIGSFGRPDLHLAHAFPPPYGYAPPRIFRLASPALLSDRWFEGWLAPGSLTARPGDRSSLDRRAGAQQQLRLELEEAIRAPLVWYVVRRDAWHAIEALAQKLCVTDDLERTWSPCEQRDIDEDLLGLCYAPPHHEPVIRVTALFPLGIDLGVLGIGGMTEAARAAASTAAKAAADEAAKLAEASKKGPPTTSGPGATQRCVLRPDRVYRIDVTMRWSACARGYDDHGNQQVIGHHPPTTSERSYWFRTAKHRAKAGLVIDPGTAQYGRIEHVRWIHHRTDLFDPAMLERHLRGYEPRQSEIDRFAGDPVAIHFGVGHIAALANAYGFEVKCVARRIDVSPAVEADQVQSGQLEWNSESHYLLDSEVARVKAYAASPCNVPPPGAKLVARHVLARQAWYEVFALAKSTDRSVEDGALPGVTFRTSRWADGREMLAALHFLPGPAGLATGGIALAPDAPLSPAKVVGDDSAFDAFLLALGLESWPIATAPRVSLLWRPDPAGSWRCAGVFVESPEPIHRAGRIEVQRLTLHMGQDGAGVTFDIHRRDRSGTRLILATSNPFPPTLSRSGPDLRSPSLELVLEDLPPGAAPQLLRGLLAVPLAPSFAEEAV